jgi:hypothetical protein
MKFLVNGSLVLTRDSAAGILGPVNLAIDTLQPPVFIACTSATSTGCWSGAHHLLN